MSDQSVHLAKWVHAPEQVTVGHLVKCPPQRTTWSNAIQDLENLTDFSHENASNFFFFERHLYKWHRPALSQVIVWTDDEG